MKEFDRPPASTQSVSQHQRMDFIQEVIASDKQAGTISVSLKPDPRRYKEVTYEGKPAFLDRYLGHMLPSDVLEQLAQTSAGIPLYVVDPKIKSAAAYTDARLEALRGELSGGGYISPEEKPYPHSVLTAQESNSITFLSVDICGATAIRAKDSSGFDRAYEVMIQELGTVAGQFGSSILKQTGDGFIAFNDHPSFTRQCDNVIDLGLTFIHLQQGAINKALEEKGLPTFRLRVGAEHGSATVKTFRNPTTGFSSVEVASDALNRAVKIQETCGCNEFRIGRRLYELIHVQWLERACAVSEPIGVQVGDPGYRVYQVK